MAIKGMFFNAVKDGDVYDRSYNADDFSIYLDKIVGNGVFPNPSTSLQARATSGMNVAIGAGQAWIDGHKIIVTADEVLTLDPADKNLIYFSLYPSSLFKILLEITHADIKPVAYL